MILFNENSNISIALHSTQTSPTFVLHQSLVDAAKHTNSHSTFMTYQLHNVFLFFIFFLPNNRNTHYGNVVSNLERKKTKKKHERMKAKKRTRNRSCRRSAIFKADLKYENGKKIITAWNNVWANPSSTTGVCPLVTRSIHHVLTFRPHWRVT